MGNNDAAHTVHLSDAHAHQLLDAGLSFVEGNHVTVDLVATGAQGTHLQNSLKDLEKLHVDAVTLTTPNSHGEVLIDLHAAGDTGDLLSVLNASLPNFSHASDITVALDLMNDPSNTSALNALASYSNAQLDQINNTLKSHGINELHETSSLDFTNNGDWLGLNDINAVHLHGVDFQVGIVGNNQVHSLDAQLSHETALSDAIRASLGDVSGNANYGELINTLKGKGVHDFLIESGNVEISDHLTSDLVDSGMLHALPGADVIIDASNEVATYAATKEAYVHLDTNLNTMAQLGVDQIDAGTASKVYLNVRDLGLPAGDHGAMAEIRNLLNSLDPANEAKLVTGENAPSISLVMSTDLLNAIADSNDHFNAGDLSHMAKLGITDITIRDEGVNHADAAAIKAADAILMGTNPADGQAPVIEVKIIGEHDAMHDVLDPTKLHLPK